MKCKKIISAVLSLACVGSAMSSASFAINSLVANGNVSYTDAALDLNACMEVTVPTLQGMPEHSKNMDVFYSPQGSFKINMDRLTPEQKRLIDDGAYIEVSFAKKPEPYVHLNPLHWENFLANKSDYANVNKLSIKGPSVKSGFNVFDYALWRNMPGLRYTTACIPAWLSYEITNIGATVAKGFLNSKLVDNISGKTILSRLTSCLVSVLLSVSPYIMAVITWANLACENFNGSFTKVFENILAPAINLAKNASLVKNPKTINFNYGIVLTDKDDEKGLRNEVLPKEGDIDPKYVIDKKQQKMAKQALTDELQKVGRPGGPGFMPAFPKDIPVLTKEDAKKLANDKAVAKIKAQCKLAESRPLTSGCICKLSASQPEQTFRLVLNNQLGNQDATLFSIALSNNIPLARYNAAQDQLRFTIKHVVPYNSEAAKLIKDVTESSNLVLSEEASDLNDKVNTLLSVNKDKVGIIGQVINWINQTFSSSLVPQAGQQPPQQPQQIQIIPGAPGAGENPEQQQQGLQPVPPNAGNNEQQQGARGVPGPLAPRDANPGNGEPPVPPNDGNNEQQQEGPVPGAEGNPE